MRFVLTLTYTAFLAMLGTSVAKADTFASMPNRVGGEILLLDTQGGCSKGLLEVAAYTEDGTAFSGCYYIRDGKVFANIEGNLRIYQGDHFTLAPKYQRQSSKSRF